MSDDENEGQSGPLQKIREKSGVIVGVVGLVAWCAMLWFMFGDVL